MVDKIKGGKSDGKSLQDIADKHNVSLSVIESALADGIKVEQEHTSDVAIATEIAKDHIFEDAEYYSKLAKVEKQNATSTWITVKPHGSESKGVHVLVKDGESKKEAIDNKFGKSGNKKEHSYNKNNEILIDDLNKISDIDRLIELKEYNEAQEKRILKGDLRPTEVQKDYKIYESKITAIDRIIDRQKAIKTSTEKTKSNIDKINELKEKLSKKGYEVKVSDFVTDSRNMVDYESTILNLEKKLNTEKQNSKDWAKTYKASNFIEKGVCTYNDETIYVSQETLQRAMQTMKGRPVVIKHQKVTPDNMQDHAVGYVTDSGQFDSFDAGFTCPFIVFDDEGKEVIAKDYSVSCAYVPKAFGKGGTWHNTPYDREVTELEFTHLALVPDPRYEDAKIYENAMDKNMDKKGKWITIKGTHVFVEEGQDVQEALDKQFNKKEIEYTGKNKKDLKDLLGDNLKISDNGKISVETEKGDINIFKDDKIKIDGNNIEIKKPSYVGGKPIIAKLKDKKSFDYVDDGEKIQIIKDDNNKYHIHYGVDKEGKATSKASGFETLEEAKKTLKKHRPNYTEKQNSTDNTTKETYNMEKIEVEQGFLTSLLALVQQPFLNAKDKEVEKEEPKDSKDAKVDDDEMEYEGKKYSKKELINCYTEKKNSEAEEEAKKGKKEEEAEEKKNAIDSDEDIEFFNSMQKLMATAQSDASDKVEIPSQTKGLELGSQAFG